MSSLRFSLPLVMVAVLSACGGSSTPDPVPQVTLSTLPIKETLAVGDELAFTVEGRVSYTGSQPLFVQLRDSGAAFVLPDIKAVGADKSIALSITTLPTLPSGQRNGTLEIKVCRDSACAQPYSGQVATLAYDLSLNAVADWVTFQRDARHSGEVPIRLDPTKFKKAWEWKHPRGRNASGAIHGVVTKAGKVFISTDVPFGEEARLYALSERDGTEIWSQSMGPVPAFDPPAIGGSNVYAAVIGHERTFLWAFDIDTGTFRHRSAFESQWSHYFAPTVFGDQIFSGGGYNQDKVYAFSTLDGSRKWAATVGSALDRITPAADDNTVYYHMGWDLIMLDKSSGNELGRIRDPYGSDFPYSYYGAPILGSRGNVISFAGATSGIGGGGNFEHSNQRKLSSFNVANRKYEWSTLQAYLTAPAVGGGVIYAARNNQKALDALDESTGKLLWNWTGNWPGTDDTTGYHRNIVLTKTHLFISTERNVYAIDLATKKPVWTYPAAGSLAISADRTLYIATGALASDGGLVAIRLN